MVLNLLEYLGLMVKPSKVEAVPTQRIEFLGMMIDTVRMLFTVPEHKVSNLRKTVRQTIDKSFLGQLTKRQLAGVIGKVTAMAGAVHPARLHTWPLIHELNLYRRDRWDKRLPPLSPECLSELRWWQLQLRDWNGRSVIPVPHSWTVTTDAAKTGWGGWWRHIDWPVHPHDQARGFFSQKESRNSSNWRELSGVLFTLQAAVNDLSQCWWRPTTPQQWPMSITWAGDIRCSTASLSSYGASASSTTFELWQCIEQESTTSGPTC